MPIGRLSPLQERILTLLAKGVASSWVLTGGAALGGFYTRHRDTRDLDLTPRDRHQLGQLPAETRRCLESAGLEVQLERLERDHFRLRVADGSEVVLIELIGGWTKATEEPHAVDLGDATIRVDSPHELLVRKLMALFDRSEPRDLQDVGALLDLGGDFDRALADASRQFTGLSARNLANVLRALPIERLGPVVHWTAEQTAAAIAVRDDLVQRLRGVDGEDD